jgi:hypothetical protein
MEKIESAEQPREPAVERKPYHSPRIEESGQFEHLVLACTKALDGPDPACDGGGASP